jgi:hypothetical protein
MHSIDYSPSVDSHDRSMQVPKIVRRAMLNALLRLSTMLRAGADRGLLCLFGRVLGTPDGGHTSASR